MAAIRNIDLEHIRNRRKEVHGCMVHGYFHAATLTACSGIELLLEFLLSRLHDELRATSKKKADGLANDLRQAERKQNAKTMYWGLRSWTRFYKKNQIFERLQRQYDYAFRQFRDGTLKEVNDIWNKCKHDDYTAERHDATYTDYLLNEYLLETEINVEDPHHRIITFGEVGNQWLKEWEVPLIDWIAANSTTPQAAVLLSLSSFLDLVIRLIDDKRLSFEHRTALMVAANYVFSSVDLLPEDTDRHNVNGLVDDGAVLALTLQWLMQQEQFDNAIVYSHWPAGEGIRREVSEATHNLMSYHAQLFPDSPDYFGYRAGVEGLATDTSRRTGNALAKLLAGKI